MKINKIIALLFVCVAIAASLPARAQNVTYTLVGWSIPATAQYCSLPGNSCSPTTISGTITTDGTLGGLTAANIVDWNVSVPDYAISVTTTYNPSNSSINLGSNDGPTGGVSAVNTSNGGALVATTTGGQSGPPASGAR